MVYDEFGAQQLPKEYKRKQVMTDIYGQAVYAGDNVIEFENGDVVQIGDFREYVGYLPDSELMAFMGGVCKEVDV